MRVLFMLAFTIGLVFCYIRLVQEQEQPAPQRAAVSVEQVTAPQAK